MLHSERMYRWRMNHLRSAMERPDIHFLKQTRKYAFPDEKFEIFWNRWKTKWELWRFSRDGNLMPCMLFETQSLDQRLILRLEERYLVHSTKSPRQLTAELDRLDEKRRELSKRDFRNKINAISTDDRRQIGGIPQVQVPRGYGRQWMAR